MHFVCHSNIEERKSSRDGFGHESKKENSDFKINFASDGRIFDTAFLLMSIMVAGI